MHSWTRSSSIVGPGTMIFSLPPQREDIDVTCCDKLLTLGYLGTVGLLENSGVIGHMVGGGIRRGK